MLPNLRRFPRHLIAATKHHFFISQILLGIAALFTLFNIPMLSQYLVDEGFELRASRTAVFRTVAVDGGVRRRSSAVFTMANAWYAVWAFSEHKQAPCGAAYSEEIRFDLFFRQLRPLSTSNPAGG